MARRKREITEQELKARAKRLREALEWFMSKGKCHDQKDFAEIVGTTGPNISAALNGRASALTDSLLERVVKSSKGAISEEWLLTGEGEMLLSKPEQSAPALIDQSSLINAIIAAHNVAISAKDETIATLRKEVCEKQEYIESLKQTVNDLRQELAKTRSAPLGYTYPTGVAEDQKG